MKVLLIAGPDRQPLLEESIKDEFQFERAADLQAALQLLAHQHFDAVLLHLDLGTAVALDLLGRLKRRTQGQVPGVVLVAREIDTQSVVEVMRAGAIDVLLERSLRPREIPHALRNAAFCAQTNTRLNARRIAQQSQGVLVVGAGDTVEAIVLLLEASGLTVRHFTQLPRVSDAEDPPRAIVVDLAAAGDGEALLRLLKPD